MTLRVDAELSRAVAIAAARAGQSVNQWCGEVLERASGAANMYALASEMQHRNILDETALQEFTERALDLLVKVADGNARQQGEFLDASRKFVSSVQSAIQACEIREGR